MFSTAAVIHPRRPDETPDDWFDRVVEANREFRVERNAKGVLEIMSPTGGRSGARNMRISAHLFNWAETDRSGQAFDSSTGFRLSNSAIRAPDASWVSQSKLDSLTEDEWAGYLPLSPDFVIELRSPSDNLTVLKAKMAEYIENGTDLGWLIDPSARTVIVYRSGMEVREFVELASISGEPTLSGFELDLTEIW